MDYLLVCRSITHAKRIHMCLSTAGIPVVIVRTPECAAPKGCSFSVRFDEQWHIKAFQELKENGLEPESILIYSDGKTIRVV